MVSNHGDRNPLLDHPSYLGGSSHLIIPHFLILEDGLPGIVFVVIGSPLFTSHAVRPFGRGITQPNLGDLPTITMGH